MEQLHQESKERVNKLRAGLLAAAPKGIESCVEHVKDLKPS